MNPEIPSFKKAKKEKNKKFTVDFKRVGLMITSPRRVFTDIDRENHHGLDWKSPILIIGLFIFLAGLLMVVNPTSTADSQVSNPSGTGFSMNFSNMNPGGMQGGVPMGMGGTNQPAVTDNEDETSTDEFTTQPSSSSSSLLSRFLSALGDVLGFLITWFLIGSLANLLTVSFGGQGNTRMALVYSAWTVVPLGIRSLMQILYLFATGSAINAAGLSGFVSSTATGGAVFLQNLLSQIDIYLIWQIVLLSIGINVITEIEKKKAVLTAVISVVIVVLLKSLLGLGIEQLSGLSLNSVSLNGLLR